MHIATAPSTPLQQRLDSHSELTRDLSTLTADELCESAAEVVTFDAIVWIEAIGIVADAHTRAAAVSDVPCFLAVFGAPVTHQHATEVLREIKARRWDDEDRRIVDRATEEAELMAEHGSTCECHRCYDAYHVADLSDVKFVGAR